MSLYKKGAHGLNMHEWLYKGRSEAEQLIKTRVG